MIAPRGLQEATRVRTVDFTADCPAGHPDALWTEQPMESESVRGQTRLHIDVHCADCPAAA